MKQASLFEDYPTPSDPVPQKQNKKQHLQTCPHCGAAIKDSFKFCSTCGQSITKLCTNGHPNALNAQYCSECGIDLKANANMVPISKANENAEIDLLAKHQIDVSDNDGIIKLFSLTPEELKRGIEECPCKNPVKVAGPGGRFLNSVPMLPDCPEDRTGSLTICNKCGEVNFSGTGYEDI